MKKRAEFPEFKQKKNKFLLNRTAEPTAVPYTFDSNLSIRSCSSTDGEKIKITISRAVASAESTIFKK